MSFKSKLFLTISILCGKKDDKIVELLGLDESDIHVASFLTESLEKKLPQAISNSKNLLSQRKEFYGGKY